MSQENVEIAKALIPQPDVNMVPLFRDQEIFARLVEAAIQGYCSPAECKRKPPRSGAF